jgi:hypothetical protein
VADINLALINACLQWLLEERQSRRLTSKLRHAIADELGISLYKQKRDAADKKMKAVIRDIEATGTKRGGRVAVLAKKATQLGMNPETGPDRLAQLIKRYNRRDRDAGLKDLARIFAVAMTDPLIAQIRDAMIKGRRKKPRGSPINS